MICSWQPTVSCVFFVNNKFFTIPKHYAIINFLQIKNSLVGQKENKGEKQLTDGAKPCLELFD